MRFSKREKKEKALRFYTDAKRKEWKKKSNVYALRNVDFYGEGERGARQGEAENKPCMWYMFVSRLAEFQKHRVYSLEGLINLLSHLGARQHNFAAHKDQQHNLGLDHAINEARKQLGLVLGQHERHAHKSRTPL